MSVVNEYSEAKNASGLWASIILEDGLTFEGLVVDEVSYGLYLSIGGDSGRLSMFPWGRITRVVYSSIK